MDGEVGHGGQSVRWLWHEERSIDRSTLFTTQLPLDHWTEVIGDPVIADAIRDRLQHSALAIHITGESYRGVKARKLASKKKDS